jgi:hypothetical protein
MPNKGNKSMNKLIVRHGEVILKQIEEIPQAAKLVKTGKNHIVGHSETGHHHVLELTTPNLRVYELDNELYLDVQDIGTLTHKKTGKDVHTPHKIVPGKYRVIIKQAFDYFKKALTKVRD